MPLISICINADTRNGYQDHETNADKMFDGCRSIDFLIDGVKNKKKFFDGFDTETILFIDQHLEIASSDLDIIRGLVDTLVIRRHTNEEKFNDSNYVAALQLARGNYVAHLDQDCAAFTSCKEPIENIISLLETYDYISYPSHWSPVAAEDQNYDYMWCSTRFFMCKRKTLDFTEIKKCLDDSDYLYNQYPASVRNPWTEHVLGLISKYNGKGVHYPPVDINSHAIFCWKNYKSGTLKMLNELGYEEVKNYINQRGGIQYPNDVTA